MDLVGGIFMVIGGLLTMIGGIGVIRFGDLMSRVHAAAKAPTLGLLFVAIGAAIEIGTSEAVVTLGLVVVLQLLTAPVATHVLARASYGQVRIELDGNDDLADHRANHPHSDSGPGSHSDSGADSSPDSHSDSDAGRHSQTDRDPDRPETPAS